MKRQFYKGDVILIQEDGKITNISTNLDMDRSLEVGEIFELKIHPKHDSIKMKVISNSFPLVVEEV